MDGRSQAGKHAALARFGLRFGAAPELAHQFEQLLDADPRRHLFQRTEAHDPPAIDHEGRGKRDSAFLSAVEQAVFLDDFAAGIAQQRKLDAEFLPHRLRARGVIDRDRNDLGSRRAKILEMR